MQREKLQDKEPVFFFGNSMLAESVVLVLPLLQTRVVLSFALLHQLLPDPLCLLHTQREVEMIVHAVLELRGQFAERSDFVNLPSPMTLLLRWDVGRGRDLDIWVHEE